MTQTSLAADHATRPEPWRALRIWHLGLLVAFVAAAIVNIQDQRISDPRLVGLASAGFLGYGVIAAVGWRLRRRLQNRLGMWPTLLLYLVSMAILFLVATIVYLVAEFLYVNGRV